MFIARARREMLEAPAQPRRTRRVLAPPDDFLFVARAARSRTRRTRAGITHGCESAGRRLEDRRDDPRDDVAGLLDDDRVAFADVLARDVLGVVQRRHRDRRAGDEHRLEHGVGRVGAGPADVDGDLRAASCVPAAPGNLNAVAHRGNLAVVPSRSRSARSSTLIDHAVGVELERRGACRPIRGRTRSSASMPSQRLPVRLDGQSASCAHLRRASPRECPAAGGSRSTGRRADT